MRGLWLSHPALRVARDAQRRVHWSGLKCAISGRLPCCWWSWRDLPWFCIWREITSRNSRGRRWKIWNRPLRHKKDKGRTSGPAFSYTLNSRELLTTTADIIHQARKSSCHQLWGHGFKNENGRFSVDLLGKPTKMLPKWCNPGLHRCDSVWPQEQLTGRFVGIWRS